MPVRLRGTRIPGSWIAASNYAAWAVASALVAWLLHRLRKKIEHTEQGPASHADFCGLPVVRECRESELVPPGLQAEVVADCGNVCGERTARIGRRPYPKARIASRRLGLVLLLLPIETAAGRRVVGAKGKLPFEASVA
jgi:hypothetical protein